MKYVIATSAAPSKESFPAFIEAVKASAAEGKNTIQGYVVMAGRGCYNHGVMIEGEDVEGFIKSLTMALMPARYSRVSDEDPEVSEGVFERR